MRNDRLAMLKDTLNILDKGYYTKNFRRVALPLTAEERWMAQVFLPGDLEPFAFPWKPEEGAKVLVENIDAFGLALRRHQEGCERILVLNHANPFNPGGGVRHGASAQEEDLCRKSSLLLNLEGEQASPYYRYNIAKQSWLSSDALIISPCVEIIKDPDGTLLDKPVVVSVMTCAAPMIAGGLEGLSEEAYRDLLKHRIMTMLAAAAGKGYQTLVLGAWGCGAFANDAAVVAQIFLEALRQIHYRHVFEHVDFAVLDRSPSRYNFNTFRDILQKC